MKLAYIAGAYRGKTISETYNNIQAARSVAVKYWQLGYAVICPHLNSGLMDGIVPDQTFLDGDIEILRRCDVIVMMPHWTRSKGAINEHCIADNLKMKINYEWTHDL